MVVEARAVDVGQVPIDLKPHAIPQHDLSVEADGHAAIGLGLAQPEELVGTAGAQTPAVAICWQP